MPFNITPSLGTPLSYNSTSLPYYDGGKSVPSPKLGSRVTGDDGHSYVFLKAAGAISANAQVTITEPAMTAVAGTGSAYYAQGSAVASGAYFWARSTAQ